MEIKYYNEKQIVGNIPVGVVFICENEPYAKIKEEYVHYSNFGLVGVNAISLSSFKLEYINENTEVQVCPNAVLKLSED